MTVDDSIAPETVPTVFISYRRDDASAFAGRLYDSLVEEFGEDHVFMDVDVIRAGHNFGSVISGALSDSTVVVAVIGPKWRGPRGLVRNPRIYDETDWVRRELEIARDLPVAVLPVLVSDARPLTPRDLPETIQYLGTIHAPSLRDDRWGDDVTSFIEELIAAHVTVMDDSASVISHRQDIAFVKPRDNRWRAIQVGILVALISVLLVGLPSILDRLSARSNVALTLNKPNALNSPRMVLRETDNKLAVDVMILATVYNDGSKSGQLTGLTLRVDDGEFEVPLSTAGFHFFEPGENHSIGAGGTIIASDDSASVESIRAFYKKYLAPDSQGTCTLVVETIQWPSRLKTYEITKRCVEVYGSVETIPPSVLSGSSP